MVTWEDRGVPCSADVTMEPWTRPWKERGEENYLSAVSLDLELL